MKNIVKKGWDWLLHILWRPKKMEEHPHPQDNEGKPYRGWDNM